MKHWWPTLLISLTGVIVVAMALSLTGILAATHADGRDHDICTFAGFRGLNAATLQRLVQPGAGSQAVAAVGFIKLDGQGNIPGRDTLGVGGVITPRTITGTFTVGRDPATGACRGTATTSVGTFSYATTGERRVTGALIVS